MQKLLNLPKTCNKFNEIKHNHEVTEKIFMTIRNVRRKYQRSKNVNSTPL